MSSFLSLSGGRAICIVLILYKRSFLKRPCLMSSFKGLFVAAIILTFDFFCSVPPGETNHPPIPARALPEFLYSYLQSRPETRFPYLQFQRDLFSLRSRR